MMYLLTLAVQATLLAGRPVTAHPSFSTGQEALQENLTAPYTAHDAFLDCQAKDLGEYVCWADPNAKAVTTGWASAGKMDASELKKLGQTPMREVVNVPVFCCREGTVVVSLRFGSFISVVFALFFGSSFYAIITRELLYYTSEG